MPSKRDECNSLVDSESEDATRKEQVDAENLSRLSSRRVWKVDRQIWNEFEKISKEDSNTKGSWSKYLPKALNRLSQRISYVTPANRARSVLGLPLLDPLCRFAVFWDGFVTLIDATYTAYIVPISVGFFTDFVSGIAVWFHAAAGVIFMANLLLGFHIGFVVQNNLNCMVVKSGPEVARHYMRHGTFTVDLISSAVYLIHVVLLGLVNETQMPPTVSERLHTTMVVMVVLRLVRLGAIFSVLKDMLLTAATGGSISRWVPPTAQYLLVIGYMLCGMVNAMASMWFFVGRLNGAYGNPNWISSYAGSLVGDGCEEVRFAWRPGDPLPPGCEGLQPSDMPTLSFWECYGVSAYFSLTTMTTVGYGDISPVYGLEFLVGFVIMLAGVMMFAVLIGSIQEIFQSACDVLKNSSALRSKLEAVDRWTEERLLPQDLRQDIRAFYHEVWVQNEDSQREMTLFEELPHELRSRTAQIVASRIMSSVDGLKDLKVQHSGHSRSGPLRLDSLRHLFPAKGHVWHSCCMKSLRNPHWKDPFLKLVSLLPKACLALPTLTHALGLTGGAAGPAREQSVPGLYRPRGRSLLRRRVFRPHMDIRRRRTFHDSQPRQDRGCSSTSYDLGGLTARRCFAGACLSATWIPGQLPVPLVGTQAGRPSAGLSFQARPRRGSSQIRCGTDIVCSFCR